MVILLYGLSGSGKSTVAELVASKIKSSVVLHGDSLREGICSDLDYSSQARTENHRRAFHIARILSLTGKVVIIAMIAPYQSHRLLGKDICSDVPYIEIFMDSSLSVCEKRDVKGLYRKARLGEISDFTGIGDPFEYPFEGANSVSTCRCSADESADEVLRIISGSSLLEFDT